MASRPTIVEAMAERGLISEPDGRLRVGQPTAPSTWSPGVYLHAYPPSPRSSTIRSHAYPWFREPGTRWRAEAFTHPTRPTTDHVLKCECRTPPQPIEIPGGLRVVAHEPQCPYERLRAQIAGGDGAVVLPSSWLP